MAYIHLSTRLGAALVCSAVAGSLTGLAGITPAQAATPTVLNMSGSSVTGTAYSGTQPQSFKLAKQADGSWGIRNFYSGQVLNMSGSSVTGAAYSGTQPQSFKLAKQADGSWGIRNFYSGRVLNMSGSSITGAAYSGTQPQSFQLVKQADGSWGIRAFYGGDRVPQNPRARHDAAATTTGESVTMDVLANDADTGSYKREGLMLDSITQPENGTAEIKDGKVVYTPNGGFTGHDTFTYTVVDIFGQKATATAHVATGAVNDAEGTPISGTAVTVNGSTVTAAPYAAGTPGQSFQLVRQGDGSWGIRNPDASKVLTMNGSLVTGSPFAGNTYQSFNIPTQGDGSSGIRNAYSGWAMTVNGTTVSGQSFAGTQAQSLQLVLQEDDTWAILTYYGSTRVSQTPQARADAATARPGTAVTVDVLANDNNAGSTTARGLELTSVSTAENGTAEIKDGKIVYTPAKDFNGGDTFTYTVTNSLGQTATATVTVTTPEV